MQAITVTPDLKNVDEGKTCQKANFTPLTGRVLHCIDFVDFTHLS